MWNLFKICNQKVIQDIKLINFKTSLSIWIIINKMTTFPVFKLNFV